MRIYLNILFKFLLLSLFIYTNQSLLGSTIEVKDEFGKPIIPNYIESEFPYTINKNFITTDNNLIIFTNYYLPQLVKIKPNEYKKIFLSRRKRIPLNVKDVNQINIIVKHNQTNKYLDKYSISKPFYLPEFSDEEIAYIYSEGYYPTILFNLSEKNRSIKLEKSDNFFKFKFKNQVTYESLFENNIVPDGYFAYKYGTILKLDGYAYEIFDKNIKTDLLLTKEAPVNFSGNVNLEFRIESKGNFLKSYMFDVKDCTIHGLKPGTYSIFVNKGKIQCMNFKDITVSNTGYSLGKIQCETAILNIHVINEYDNPIENCEITIFPNLASVGKTDKNGNINFEIKIPNSLKINVFKPEFAKYFSELIGFETNRSETITLTKGSTISLEYPHPENKILIKGFGIKHRQPLEFIKVNDLFVAKFVTEDNYKLNFTDFDSHFSKKMDLEIEDGKDYYFDLTNSSISISGIIEPEIPTNFNGKIKLKNSQQTISSNIEKDSSFFISDILFGTYTGYIESNLGMVIAVLKDIKIDESTSKILLSLPGFFWSGNIRTNTNYDAEGLTAALYESTNKLIWNSRLESKNTEIYIPNNCEYVIFEHGGLTKKIEIEELKKTDNVVFD